MHLLQFPEIQSWWIWESAPGASGGEGGFLQQSASAFLKKCSLINVDNEPGDHSLITHGRLDTAI